jgi:hypothetical protein
MAYFDWGWFIALLFAIGAFTLLVTWLIHEWRSDRVTAIETFAIMIVLVGGSFALEVYLGASYRWLVVGPALIWYAGRWFMSQRRMRAEAE